MADWIVWFVLGGVLLIMEIFTGTFYLLMIALGLAAGGAAALAGASQALQLIVAAIVGVGATWTLRRTRFGRTVAVNAAHDPNVNLDIGQSLPIEQWNIVAGGAPCARTMYRGAMWDVELAPGAVPQAGMFVIIEVRGSRLIVTDSASAR